MLPFDEREDHCRRVAGLAYRTSALLPLSGASREDLVAAATVHDAAGAVPFAAARILERLYQKGKPPSDDLGLAARILEVCDAFDEAMEFAVFERNSLADAADLFYRETAGQFDSSVVMALRRVTSGTEHRPSSPLPVMPRKAAALLRTTDENVSPVQLAAIAVGDPVLSSRLIGAANSCAYGSRHTITGLNEAALRVGVPAARKVLLAACLGGLFASKPLQELWLHCQEVAGRAFEIALECGIDSNAAWLAGLLHDIGRLVLLSCPPAAAVKLMELQSEGFPLVYAEMLTFGKDHAATGAALLREWNVPREIAAAVEMHHEPERSPDALASVLFLAEENECLSAKLRFRIAGHHCPAVGAAAGLAGAFPASR